MRLDEHGKDLKTIAKLSGSLAEQLELFWPMIDYGDRIWKFYLNFKRKWALFGAKEYDGKYYFFSDLFENYCYDPKTGVVDDVRDAGEYIKALPLVLDALKNTYAAVKKDSIAYHKLLMRSISAELREGLIHRTFIRELIPDWMRYDQDLGENKVKSVIRLLESYGRDECIETITA